MSKSKKYVPKYQPCEVVVNFKKKYSTHFVSEFGETLGYKLIGEQPFTGDYIFSTLGKSESSVLDEFRVYNKFVAYCDLRDVKLESRWIEVEDYVENIRELLDCEENSSKYGELEKILEKARELSDECDICDEEFEFRFKEIKSSLLK